MVQITPPWPVRTRPWRISSEGSTSGASLTRRLLFPHGYHSRMMEPIVEPYRRVAASVSFRSPETNFFSTLSGTRAASAQELTDPVYWAREARETIRFSPALEALAAIGTTESFLRSGPGQLLSKLVKVSSGGFEEARRSLFVPKFEADDFGRRLCTLDFGQALAGGAADQLGRCLWRGAATAHVACLGYPFERQRYWIEREPRKKRPDVEKAGLEGLDQCAVRWGKIACGSTNKSCSANPCSP